MLRPRVIPCLLMKNGGLVKTRQFGSPKYVGDPLNAVKIFNEKEVDELILLDIGPTAADRPQYRLLEKVAVESRMPLCYGGGVNSVEQAQRLIGMGFEKVSVSSAALLNPPLVKQLAEAVGTQSVVVTIDVRNEKGSHAIYLNNGTTRVQRDLMSFCAGLVESGVGEIVVNSIDREGEMSGYDIPLAKRLAAHCPVPLTFLGGAGNSDHMRELIDAVGIVGLAAGSMFVFKGPYRAVLISYSHPFRERIVIPETGSMVSTDSFHS